MSFIIRFDIRSAITLMVILMSISVQACFAQKRDSTLFFKSALSITQNGFSFIPSFSLGKPAIIFEPSIGNKRLSFEPQFRFALEGKPWSFIFIYKYRLVDRSKFSLQVGGHIPALIFSTQTVIRNGATEDVIVSQRFLAAELVPNYTLSKNVSIGMYLLRGHGFDKGGIQDSYYAGLRSTITNLNITKRIFFKLNPQVYYLKTDDKDGVYITNTLTLAMRHFPISISNIINKAIQTDIPGKDFDWNVSVVYSFDKNYIRH
ncbi:MAG: hypothetical protein J0L67_10325 [Cytophagales bacterium]|nr:hypothetical protein [Cytophagales bacterium]